MNRAIVKQFRLDFAKAVEGLEKQYDAQIALGSISYGDTKLTTKVTVTEKPKNGKSIEQVNFEQNCVIFGLKKSDYGREFQTHNGTYTLSGLKPRSPKYPILGTDEKGGRYKFQPTVLERLV